MPACLKLIILPPWWKTDWAYLVYFILFSLLLYAFISLLMTRAKQTHSLKIERMEREKDEELSEQKMQFFTNISHEFRTPLSLILSPLEILINSSQLTGEIKNQLSVMKRNADRLFRLVNELMDLQKIDNQKLKLKVQQGDIAKFISEISGYFYDIANRKKIEYRLDFISEMHLAWFDREKLEKILFNLISNALKFVPVSGKVTLHAEIKRADQLEYPISPLIRNSLPSSCFLLMNVCNNGKGIDPTDIPFVFDRFYQGKNAENKKHSGTGIGLSLTKSLTVLHHGNIFVESKPDKETRFTLILPISREEYSKDEIDLTPNDITDLDPHRYTDNTLTDLPEAEINSTTTCARACRTRTHQAQPNRNPAVTGMHRLERRSFFCPLRRADRVITDA